MAAVANEGGWGFIDRSGNVVIPLKYFNVEHFIGGVATVMLDVNGKMGLIDKTGETVVDFGRYDFIQGFASGTFFGRNGFSLVRRNGKYGFIDKSGTEVVPVKCRSIEVASKRLTRTSAWRNQDK